MHPKLKIIEICQRLYQKGLLFAADGNVSIKISDDEILITPSGVQKGTLKADQIATVNIEGKVLKGKPSSELVMHLEVYRKCPKATSVIHAHPPTAIAWTIVHPELKQLQAEAMSEVILAVGSLPIVPFALPGTPEMGTNLHPYLPQSRVMILARHGAISWGESMDEAFNGMERLENSAHILKMAHDLGGITTLPKDQVAKLNEMRKNIGEKNL